MRGKKFIIITFDEKSDRLFAEMCNTRTAKEYLSEPFNWGIYVSEDEEREVIISPRQKVLAVIPADHFELLKNVGERIWSFVELIKIENGELVREG